jgi:hypothetical protein
MAICGTGKLIVAANEELIFAGAVFRKLIIEFATEDRTRPSQKISHAVQKALVQAAP